MSVDSNTVAVIGMGRVGLPFSLFLDSLGFNVIGVDRDKNLIEMIGLKKMPFAETGCQALLDRARLKVSDSIEHAAQAKYLVVTVGTPLVPNIETDLSAIRAVFAAMLKVLRPGHVVILRSTVAPETTSFLKNYIEANTDLRVGRDIALAFCPERLAENKALDELRKLPQVIGSNDELSRGEAEGLFAHFKVKLFHTNYVAAELVKLFNNASRYVDFALANQFAIIAGEYGQNIYQLRQMANEDYPRGFIYSPGLTAGTCLRKDFGFINERHASPDLFLSAWKVNEYMPYYLVKEMTSRTSLTSKNVAVLGYTFKRDTDDVRDSLVPKLIRYIERQVPAKITLHEPFREELTLDGYANVPLKQCLEDAQAVFVAMNHSQFTFDQMRELVPSGTWVIDIWNCLGRGEFIFQT